jgi:hypothetical protein
MTEMTENDKEKQAAVLVMQAAAEIRKAAGLDRKRKRELSSVADYLESIVYESELGYGEPLYPEPAPPASSSATDEIRKMMKPFRVRLSR